MSKAPANAPTYIRISDLIRKDIFAGAFVPGQRLKVLDLAERYATSQMPIREALHILQGEGLVQVLPNRGAVVQAINEKFLSDHYDMLKAIEMLLVRRAAEAVAPEAIPLIKGEADRFRKAADKGETAACLRADKRFHNAINRFSRNDLALDFVERQSKVPDAQRLRVGYSSERLLQAAAEHDQLVEALSRNDGEGAARIMDVHLVGAKQDLFERLAETRDLRFGGYGSFGTTIAN
ncbi:GntR family transcriptional regulator [Neorhizobium petrolearium]|uniref:GntR family transcriptional regulator n=1 Tax=Neorhizobium petrolearium TaxID=515361 RepID=UPI003F183F5E